MLIGKQNIPPSVDSTDKSALSGGINCTERFSKIHMLYASLDNIFLYQLEENSMWADYYMEDLRILLK